MISSIKKVLGTSRIANKVQFYAFLWVRYIAPFGTSMSLFKLCRNDVTPHDL